jgi:hypothetical protein
MRTFLTVLTVIGFVAFVGFCVDPRATIVAIGAAWLFLK